MAGVVTLVVTVLFLLGTVAYSFAERRVFPVRLTNRLLDHSSSCFLPDFLLVEIKSIAPFPEFLKLHRKDVINTDAPAYIAKRNVNGAIFMQQLESGPKETAAYQNREEGAAFIASCAQNELTIEGTVYVDGGNYRVKRLLVDNSFPSPGPFRDYEFLLIKSEYNVSSQRPRRLGRNRGTLDLHSRNPHVSQGERAKRQSKDYYLDILVIVDYACYQYWLKRANNNSMDAIRQLKVYIAYIFNGINARFDSITSAPFHLHIILSSFVIAMTADQSPWTEEVKEGSSSKPEVSAERVLDKLQAYVRDNNTLLPAHDHVMLFTEYNLYSVDNGYRFNNTAGYAFIGGICYADGRSVSVVEDHGGFQSEATATHELGHSLGAQHDGINNSCRSEDRFIMAGGVHPETESTKRNPWAFSPCSIRYFEDHVQLIIEDGLEGSCLLKQLITQTDVPKASGFPGQLSGPDEQCRQIYGPNAYLCREARFGKPEDVCLSMFCKNPNTTSTCTLYTAAAGTCCGHGKWCIDGVCVNASQDANCYTSETCPFGQRQGVIIENRTCDQLEPARCYQDNFRQICCEMCDRSRTNVTGCEYGDKVTGCEARGCGLRLESGDLYDVDCCVTCNKALATAIKSSTSITPMITPFCSSDLNGTTWCTSLLEREGLSSCCRSEVMRDCCHSCDSRKSTITSCPFGDCSGNCTSLLSQDMPCTSIQRAKCCQTCGMIDRKQNISTTSSSTSEPATASSSSTTRTTTTTSSSTTRKISRATNGMSITAECKELLGVITCGSSQMEPEWIALILVLTYLAIML